MKRIASSVSTVTLRTLSPSMRVLFTCFLVTIGIGYIAAVFYLFLVDIDPHKRMGMSVPEGISMKYHGERGNTRLEAALRGAMADKLSTSERDAVLRWVGNGAGSQGYESIKPLLDKNCATCHNQGGSISPLTSYEAVRKVTQVDTGPGFDTLARVSHVHLFGISMIFLLTGGIFALSDVAGILRLLIIAIPYVAIWADIGSWWITKYQPLFAYVVLIGGGLMGLALATQILISLWEMWFRRPVAALSAASTV